MQMNKFNLKPALPHVKAILVFIIISFLYFSPEIFEGQTVLGGDSRTGSGQDVQSYRQQTGETSRWTNSLFSGMPTYQISPSYNSSFWMNQAKSLYGLYLPGPASFLFIMMLGFYILLIVFGARTDLAILGAIGYAFSSYFFIIIEAGHIWKVLTLAYIPPTIAGIVLAYKGKYISGCIVTALFLAFQISSNHIQMTYYSLFIIGAIVIWKFVNDLKERQLPRFFKASATCCVAALIAVSVNLSNLYHTWEYSQETIRGKSELSHNADNKTDTGLDRDYMVAWSYGIGETWSLLIPNAKGGASGYLGNNDGIKDVSPQFQQTIAQQNHYWGDQPFTSGPVYAGAFFMTLFIMSLFLLKTKLKWYLLAVLMITVFLGWGKNFMAFTNFFADYFPMYSKFRSVSSILIVAELIIPLLAILMLIEIVKNPRILVEKKKEVFISFGLTGGIALLFALMPGVFFNFLSEQETNSFLPQAAQNPQVGSLINALEDIRMNIFRSDAWRSVIIIAIGGTLLFLYARNKLQTNLFVGLLIALCLGDMWMVNKRYLNASAYISKQQVKNYSSFFPQSPADIEILKDKDPNYRVFNTTVNSFNDATTSYYHKSVGGYNAAKLRRYQDLIDHHLSQGNMPVFNMLNTKYFIVPDQNKQPQAQHNPGALGNAWFVDSIKWVNNADEEINALTGFNPSSTAFIDKRFESGVKGTIAKDSLSNIRLTEYKPNEQIYASNSPQDGFVVFSEVYYPHGWKATIDGQEAPIVRTNYVLRGIYVPAGEHKIVMTFRPASIQITEIIAYCGIIILAIAIIFSVLVAIRNEKRNIQK